MLEKPSRLLPRCSSSRCFRSSKCCAASSRARCHLVTSTRIRGIQGLGWKLIWFLRLGRNICKPPREGEREREPSTCERFGMEPEKCLGFSTRNRTAYTFRNREAEETPNVAKGNNSPLNSPVGVTASQRIKNLKSSDPSASNPQAQSPKILSSKP